MKKKIKIAIFIFMILISCQVISFGGRFNTSMTERDIADEAARIGYTEWNISPNEIGDQVTRFWYPGIKRKEGTIYQSNAFCCGESTGSAPIKGEEVRYKITGIIKVNGQSVTVYGGNGVIPNANIGNAEKKEIFSLAYCTYKAWSTGEVDVKDANYHPEHYKSCLKRRCMWLFHQPSWENFGFDSTLMYTDRNAGETWDWYNYELRPDQHDPEVSQYGEDVSNWQFENNTQGKATVFVSGDKSYIGPYNVNIVNTKINSVYTSSRNHNVLGFSYSVGGNIIPVGSLGNVKTDSLYIVINGIPTEKLSLNIDGEFYREEFINAEMMFLCTGSNHNNQNIIIYHPWVNTEKRQILWMGEVDPPVAHMTLKKVDADNQNLELKNTRFIVQTPNNQWVKDGGSGTISRVNNPSEATVYTSGQTIRNMDQAGTYRIYEVQRESDDYAFVNLDKRIKIAEVQINFGDDTTIIMTNKKKYFYVKLKKTDTHTGVELNNARFVLAYLPDGDANGRKEYVIGGNDANNVNAQYVSDIKRATQYKTGNRIERLTKEGKYAIYEIKEQDSGYEHATLERPLLIKQIDLNIPHKGTNDEDIKISLTNTREYIDLSGYVWEDRALAKDVQDQKPNNIFDNNNIDKLLKNITVRLKDANGNIVQLKDLNGEYHPAEKLTGANGAYKFEKVEIEKLNQYYIEFEYNGMCYQNVAVNTIARNGSKASEGNERQTFNDGYETITEGQSNKHTLVYAEEFNGDQVKDKREYQYTSELLYRNENKTKANKYDGYLYGYDGQTYPVSGIDNQYKITANTKNAYDEVLGSNESHYLDAAIVQDGLATSNYKKQYKDYKDYIRRNKILEIPNMNLGIVERKKADIKISSADVNSVRVNINDSQHVFKYEKRYEKNNEGSQDPMNPTIAYEFKDGGMYTEAVYASDIHATKTEADNSKVEIDDILTRGEDKTLDGEDKTLDVNVTYRIRLGNTLENGLTAIINHVEDYYDNKYSNVVAVGTEIDDRGNIKENARLDWESIKSKNSNYKGVDITTNITLKAGETKDIYVQLKVSPDKIVELLRGNNPKPVELYNYAEITSYSMKDVDENGKLYTYGVIDKNSQPGNLQINGNTVYEDDADKAPGFQLVLQEERKVSGTIFVDSTTGELKSGEIRQGEGIYEERKETLEGVEVKLISKTSGSIAKVWNETDKKWKDAEFTTKKDGNYLIGGFIPDDYTVEYTWGDENHKVQDYKSTIVDEASYDAKGDGDSQDKEWYKKEFKKKYPAEWDGGKEIRVSDAVDDYKLREEIDKQTNIITYANKEAIKEYSEDTKIEVKDKDGKEAKENLITKMTSTTPVFRVNVEYSDTPVDSREQYDLKDGKVQIDSKGYVIKKEEYKNHMKTIDFGIVERARQALKLSKRITNAKITLADGTVLINAKIDENGELVNVDELKHVVYLPDSPGAKGQVKFEIDNEIIQGSKLEIQYQLQVTNISELEYRTEDYYKYGKGHGERDLITLKASKVIDYLDNNMATDMPEGYLGKMLQDNKEKQEQLIDKGLLTDEIKEYLTTKIQRTLVIDKLAKDLTPVGDNAHTEVILTTYKLLTNIANEESIFENEAEIIQVEKPGGSTLTTIPGDYVPSSSEPHREDDDDSAESVLIVPPTGLNTNYITYIILAISSLGVVIGGIILIKKYVLK